MTLHVFSARISTRDPDRFDISRKSATEGLFLAPSWALLSPFLQARWNQPITKTIWQAYAVEFRAEMRQSYRQHRAQWDALLARERVVLTCFCTNPEQCHRAILRRDILPALGAIDAGELA